MRLVIDLQALQNDSRDRGIGRHARDFVAALTSASDAHEYILLCNSQLLALDSDIIERLRNGNRRVTFLNFESLHDISMQAPENSHRALLAQLIYEKMLADLAPNVVLVASTIEGFLDDTVVHGGNLFRSYILGSIFYDLIPLSEPDLYLPGEQVKAWFNDRLAGLSRADFILTNSNTSRNEAVDILRFPEEHVHSPGSAVDTHIFVDAGKPDPAILRERFGIERRYVMHAGAFEPRKNFEGLLREFGHLPKHVRNDVQLVFVCAPPEPGRRRLDELARKIGLDSDQLIITGFVSDTELVALYSGATVFAFPSLREGFGLPPLEAMSCGTATIASNNSSLPEVIGHADALFDPLSKGSLATLLEKVLTDDQFRLLLQKHARHQSRLFDWAETARRALAAIEWEFEQSHIRMPPAPLSMEMVLERIVDIYADAHLERADIADAATALAENERVAMHYLGHAAQGGVQSWQIEGPIDSSYSLALVNRTLARSLSRLGHTIKLVSTDGDGDFEPDTDFLEANPDLDRMISGKDPTQSSLEIISRNLYPPRTKDMRGQIRALHCYAWEETAFPYWNVIEFNANLDVIFATSRHVEKLLIDNGVAVPIHVCGVGVDHLDAIESDRDYRLEARPFRFLHISSGLARKGIDILLDAFGDAFGDADPVSLVIKTAPSDSNEIESLLASRRKYRSDFPHVVVLWDDLTPTELKALHLQCHVGVYPSRAEGFGLPIAEAMICGLPVITTAWGGQSDFCLPSDTWLIDFDFELARTHLGLVGSVWARPHRKMLADCLLEAFTCDEGHRKLMARRAKARILHDNNWRLVASRHVSHIRNLSAAPTVDNPPRVGWITTWNEPCGIATYSRHILEHFDLPTEILTRQLAWKEGDCHTVHKIRPIWQKPSDGGNVSGLASLVNRFNFDIIIIQFSFAFFDLDELAELIERASRNGVTVLIELHATSLPREDGERDVLDEMRGLLGRCARVLVHSVADLNRLKRVGLIENVTLLPHGFLAPPSEPDRVGQAQNMRRPEGVRVIASFGFALPHKGLIELVESVALLRDAGTPVRLRLLNAEFPAPSSRLVIECLRIRIAELELTDLVECNFAFQSEAAITEALAAADLIVFPYQHTDESASGAIRHALVSGRPIAVTPIPMFSEFDDLVHVMPGCDPAAIASGIRDILGTAAGTDLPTQSMRGQLDNLTEQLSFQRIAARLEGMCRALVRENRNLARTYPASAPQFQSKAQVVGQGIINIMADGEFLRGPGLILAPSRYEVIVEGRSETIFSTLPKITIELDGIPCAPDEERAEKNGTKFSWHATIDITSKATKFDIAACPASVNVVYLDVISIHPTGSQST